MYIGIAGIFWPRAMKLLLKIVCDSAKWRMPGMLDQTGEKIAGGRNAQQHGSILAASLAQGTVLGLLVVNISQIIEKHYKCINNSKLLFRNR